MNFKELDLEIKIRKIINEKIVSLNNDIQILSSKDVTDIICCNTNNPKAKNVLEIKELLPENNDNVNPEQSQRQSWYESSFEDILES